jgi:hypothetical protein
MRQYLEFQDVMKKHKHTIKQFTFKAVRATVTGHPEVGEVIRFSSKLINCLDLIKKQTEKSNLTK